MQVNAKIGFTFHEAFRSFLRSDPDVIMVGEMRDAETARTAISASLTGHLVLSTIHTNNAPETVVRLVEMGMDPISFSEALAAVLAQRLVQGGLSEKFDSSLLDDRMPRVARRVCEKRRLWIPLPYHPAWSRSLSNIVKKFSRDRSFSALLGMASRKWANTIVSASWSNYLPSLCRRFDACGRRQG